MVGQLGDGDTARADDFGFHEGGGLSAEAGIRSKQCVDFGACRGDCAAPTLARVGSGRSLQLHEVDDHTPNLAG